MSCVASNSTHGLCCHHHVISSQTSQISLCVAIVCTVFVNAGENVGVFVFIFFYFFFAQIRNKASAQKKSVSELTFYYYYYYFFFFFAFDCFCFMLLLIFQQNDCVFLNVVCVFSFFLSLFYRCPNFWYFYVFFFV